jgi:RHS repeat-associated protein
MEAGSYFLIRLSENKPCHSPKAPPNPVSYSQQNQPYRYSTKWTHEASGLSYFGARWYDSDTGRFINRGPIREEGGLTFMLLLIMTGLISLTRVAWTG